MRFLLDEQLSPKIVRWLCSKGFEAHHVAEFGLLGMSDKAVVEQAVRLGAVIVSKDADYRAWPAGLPVPLVSILIGNVSNEKLLACLEGQWPSAVDRLQGGERIVLVF